MIIILDNQEPDIPQEIFAECHGVIRMLPKEQGYKFYVLKNEGVPETVHPMFLGASPAAKALESQNITMAQLDAGPSEFIYPIEQFDHVFREHDTLEQKKERAIAKAM